MKDVTLVSQKFTIVGTTNTQHVNQLDMVLTVEITATQLNDEMQMSHQLSLR